MKSLFATIVLLSPVAALVMVLTGIWSGDGRWTATGVVLAVCSVTLIALIQRQAERKRPNPPEGWTLR